MLYLLWPEVVGLEVQAGEVGAAIVHEPDGHGQRRQQISNVRGNDLSSIPIEPVVPLENTGFVRVTNCTHGYRRFPSRWSN
jgi:hypothetical protein